MAANTTNQKRVEVQTLGDPIVVEQSEFNGTENVSIRFWYRHRITGELMPSRYGINFPVQYGSDVYAALGKVLGVSNQKPKKNRKK